MTENEFMERLGRGLGDIEGREEILRDYREHFAAGRDEGRTDDEIGSGLGDPARIAAEYRGGSRERPGETLGDSASYDDYGRTDSGEPGAHGGRRRAARVAGIAIVTVIAAIAVVAGAVTLARAAAAGAERARAASAGDVDVVLPGISVHVGKGGVRTDVGSISVDVGHGGAGFAGFPLAAASEAVDLRKAAALSGVSRLSLSGQIADIEVTRSGEGEVSVRLSGEVPEGSGGGLGLEFTRSGDSLGLAVRLPESMETVGNCRLVLDVSLPESFGGEVELESETGCISFQGKAARIKAVSSTGDLTVLDAAGPSELESETGDLTLVFEKPAPARLHSSTGSASVDTRGAQAFSYRASSETGEVAIRGVASRAAVSGSVGTGGPLIEASSETGDVTID